MKALRVAEMYWRCAPLVLLFLGVCLWSTDSEARDLLCRTGDGRCVEIQTGLIVMILGLIPIGGLWVYRTDSLGNIRAFWNRQFRYPQATLVLLALVCLAIGAKVIYSGFCDIFGYRVC
ncbi:MAG: hypothetical protein Kow00114_08400 [Kiloniellaceae bacterium]